eukprot:6187673-Prymnesium_polylepis.1
MRNSKGECHSPLATGGARRSPGRRARRTPFGDGSLHDDGGERPLLGRRARPGVRARVRAGGAGNAGGAGARSNLGRGSAR